jgi:alpha-galactosidase
MAIDGMMSGKPGADHAAKEPLMRRRVRLTASLLAAVVAVPGVVVAGFVTAAPAAAAPIVQLTAPPMGWNSWNRFGCDINESLIRGVADAIVANNLDDLGYRYVNIDDCWMASTRDGQGRLQPHPTRFASGIRALADYVHARGLKLGIYSSAGTATCQGLPASLDHETIDAQTFADWQIDYLKYDNCNNQGRPAADRYRAMGDALRATGRPIVYSICNWGQQNPWLFGSDVGGSLWRTTGDISDNWNSVLSLLDQQAGLEPFARQGAYNDPDMLEVGNGGMTTTEYTAHFSLWALLASPLLLGNDLRSVSSTTLGIIRNAEVIAVNQDWGGSQGRRIRDFGNTEVWAKPMSDGSAAVVLFNRGGSAATVTTSAAELGLGGSSSYTLRNLWTGATSSTSGAISASVAAHGAVMFRVGRAGTALPPPAAGTHQAGAMTWLASSNGWGPVERNVSNGEQAAGDGRPLTVNGTVYASGIGAHADSAVHIWLGRACSRFTAQVGVDDEVTTTGSVRFQVYGDGRLLGYSDVKTSSAGPSTLSVTTTGYSTLELRVTDGRNGISYDHADWGDAVVTC